MAASADGDDITAGETNTCDSGTELICNPRDGVTPNDFVLQVKPSVFVSRAIDGIRGEGPGAVGVLGTGRVGVEGKGSGVGVIGRLGEAPAPLPPPMASAGVFGFDPTSRLSAGVIGESANGIGVFGTTTSGTGVRGESSKIGIEGVGETGVRGLGSGNSSGTGVLGSADAGTGVLGSSVVGTGVKGTGKLGVAGNGTNIGVSGTSGANGFGVLGNARGPFSAGVRGDHADVGAGVQGFSIKGTGGHFVTEGGVAILGIVQQVGPPGPIPTLPGFAGVFSGGRGVLISGDLVTGSLTVAPGGAKSAAVPHPDGSHRLLYCLECPEGWFEDFGDGMLTKGKAHVRLDPDFAAVVDTDRYHVFLSPYGESHGLYVLDRDHAGFTVHEQQGGRSDIPFSYRIVAKRKDLKTERLANFILPVFPHDFGSHGVTPTEAVGPNQED